MPTVMNGTTTRTGLVKLYDLMWIHLDDEVPLRDFYKRLAVGRITQREEFEISSILMLVVEPTSDNPQLWSFELTITEIPASGNMSVGRLPELLAESADFGVSVSEPPVASE